ncbi:MAG: hypothetical protein U9N82_06275 [Thermodesulfobacteriota bacterium]|nr:hypothetical protein [Thermodesulfobacteriota bacterium]
MKTKMFIIFLVLIFLVVFNNLVFAGEIADSSTNEGNPATAEVEEEMISEASEPVEEDPGKVVDNLLKEYLNDGRGKAIRDKISKEGGWIGYSTAEVSVGPENPNWAKNRVFAYEKALIDIENQYLLTQNQTIKAGKLRAFFKNASDVVPDFQPKDMGDPGKVGKLIDKLLAVAEGKLDKTLDELGIDKEQFNRTPKAQRHTLLSESLSKSTIVESIGSLAGLIPIQTFEGFNSQKEHVVGVICIATPNTKQFAYDILHSRGQLQPYKKKGKDLYDLFSKDDNLLIDQFGIRKMKDEDGYPVLISFGQWANSKNTGDKRLMRRYRKAAKKQAASSAKNQIALFLAGNSIFQSNADIGEQFKESYNVHHDNYKEQDMVNSIMDGIRETSKSGAKVTMSGLVQLYSWTTKHPQYGHEIVGVVMKWSPKDEKQARKLREWKPERNKTIKKTSSSPTKQLKGSSGTKKGQEYMDSDDF